VEDVNAVIISEDGREFNVAEIYKAESSFISGLKSMEDFSHIEIPSNDPPEIDEEMLEVFLTTIVIFLYLSHYSRFAS
jgi:nuclear GTP-binding protein